MINLSTQNVNYIYQYKLIMSDFVTVLTMSYPQQLYIIKGRLESEGIQCFIKDELTVQSNNFWSNAVGGVKLQVQNQDVERAVALLTELGYIKDEPIQVDLLTKLDAKTSGIPLLKKTNIVNRIIILTIVAITVITTLCYFILKPSTTELLTKTWCVDNIYYNNKLIGPKTLNAIYITYTNGETPCYENINIRENGDIDIPGVNTRGISGSWKIINDESLQLTVDTLANIFQGTYIIDVNSNKLVLKSKTTTINAHIDKTSMPNMF